MKETETTLESQTLPQEERPCELCHGEGEVMSNPGYPDPQGAVPERCPDCGGSGVAQPGQENSQPEPAARGEWQRIEGADPYAHLLHPEEVPF